MSDKEALKALHLVLLRAELAEIMVEELMQQKHEGGMTPGRAKIIADYVAEPARDFFAQTEGKG